MTVETGTFTASDGIELFTRAVPAAEPRHELLIVHGVGEHSGRWVHQAELFAGNGANVTMFDLRGHGNSGGPVLDTPSIERFHEDIAEVAAATVATTGRPWVLMGHSLGGLLCAGYLVDQHHPTPNIAVLSAPALDDGLPAALKGVAKVLGGVAGGIRVDNTINGEHLSRDPAVGERYEADELVHTKGTLRLGKSIFTEMSRVRSRADEITVPTLVYHGAEDVLVPTAASAPLAASQGVERKVLPGLRHETHNEPEGDHVIGDVIDWINKKLH
jgi:alpha-beta hydrolase superfamily lysophospholipase